MRRNKKHIIFQANDYMLRHYNPIQHEDGLETAILGLEFEVTHDIFNSRRKKEKKRNKSYGGYEGTGYDASGSGFESESSKSTFSFTSPSSMKLTLKCLSAVRTEDTRSMSMKTHHEKSTIYSGTLAAMKF